MPKAYPLLPCEVAEPWLLRLAPWQRRVIAWTCITFVSSLFFLIPLSYLCIPLLAYCGAPASAAALAAVLISLSFVPVTEWVAARRFCQVLYDIFPVRHNVSPQRAAEFVHRWKVKDERFIDRYDRVFSHYFRSVEAVSGEGTDPRALPEEWLRRPLSAAALTADRADLFGRLVMQIYGFGAQRPKLSTARAYGEIFENCLRIADWALRRKDLTVLARIIYCICLIDPDHDVGPWLSDIVASQRPDGSFPDRTGFGTQDQDFAVAGRSTIAAVAALHMVRYRRWHKPPPDRMAA